MTKQRKDYLMIATGCLGGIALPFYIAFVVQNLWNWFVADALHGAAASYPQSLGMMILLYVLKYRPSEEFREEQRWRWERLLATVDACVPYDRKNDLEAARNLLKSPPWHNNMYWLGNLTISSVGLLFGFLIHTVAM